MNVQLITCISRPGFRDICSLTECSRLIVPEIPRIRGQRSGVRVTSPEIFTIIGSFSSFYSLPSNLKKNKKKTHTLASMPTSEMRMITLPCHYGYFQHNAFQLDLLGFVHALGNMSHDTGKPVK